MRRRIIAICIVFLLVGAALTSFRSSPRHVSPQLTNVAIASAPQASGDAAAPGARQIDSTAADAAALSRIVAAASRNAKSSSKVNQALTSLANDPTPPLDDLAARLKPSVDTNNLVPVTAVATGSSDRLIRDLKRLGLTDVSSDQFTVSGRLPVSKVSAAGKLTSLRYLRPAWRTLSVGAVDTQGDRSMKADLSRQRYGVSGKGLKVGVISDSFNCQKKATDAVASGDLAPDFKILAEGDCADPQDSSDEGMAMAEIVHDVAPGASILFHARGISVVAMSGAIGALVRAGAKVIVDDVGFADEPWFQDGTIAQAVDRAKAAGVSYFSAAGNGGKASYESAFDAVTIRDVRVHDFDPGPGVDPFQHVTVAPGASFIEIQWSDNFKLQAPTGPSPKSSLILLGLTNKKSPVISIPAPSLSAVEPFAQLLVVNPTTTSQPVDLAVQLVDGTAPRFFKWSLMQGSDVRVGEFGTGGSTALGHAVADGAMAVGAVNFRNTPAFGKPLAAEPYSSRGGSPLLFDKNGRAFGKPSARQKPNVMAPDDVNTSTFGDPSDDGDPFPNFSGTSAAAPHAAAVAALLLEKVPQAMPIDVCNALTATAVDIGKKGFDFDNGYGFVDAGGALGWLTAPGKKGPCPSAAIPYVIKKPALNPVTTVVLPTAKPQEPQVPVAPPVATPAPTPTPTPLPYPMVFADQDAVVAGEHLAVSGWELPKFTSVSVSLDGEQSLGSARTDKRGFFRARLVVPRSASAGSHVLAASFGGRKITAAQPVFVVKPVVFQQRVARSDTVEPASKSTVLPMTMIVLAAMFLAVVLTLSVGLRRR